MSAGAGPGPEFDGPSLAKHLLRTARAGALATLDRTGGAPFASLVNVATDVDGSPLLLLSRLAAHTLNLEADARASLLLSRTGKGDPLAHPRLTVIGRAGRTDAGQARDRFLSRHPKSKLYAGFADFSFWRLEIESGHLNGGFARAMTVEAQALRTDFSVAENLVATAQGLLDELNGDREMLGVCARIAGEPSGRWRATGVDPEGLDLMSGERSARLTFAARVASGDELRKALKDLREAAPALDPERRGT